MAGKGKREHCPHCGAKVKAGYAGWWCNTEGCKAGRMPLSSWQLVEKPKRKRAAKPVKRGRRA